MSTPKYRVKTIKNVCIPMRDGINLSADLYMPLAEGKFPAILCNYVPYRKDDRLLPPEHYFAQRGMVVAELDVRGTGGSEGFVTDEYTQIEREDGYDAIEWLAKQDWCNRNVGMMGKSYGGYSTLEVAMLQPPSLKAIVPIMGTDDRYSDGDQYIEGGAKRGLMSTATYATFMVAMNALPPYPQYAGEEWAKIWRERLKKSTPWILEWVGRQVDDEYWQECLGRRWYQVKCPAFIIGGWMDPFLNAMPRLYAELKVPKKLLMGCWPHNHPDTAIPGPRIDWLREIMQWFAYWLRGDDTGIMDEPPVTIYVQKYEKPERVRDLIKGFWRNEDAWPPSRMTQKKLYLGEGELTPKPPDSKHAWDSYDYNPLVGLCGGPWFGGSPTVMSTDQRGDDALSICYDTPPLDSEIEIAGWPHAIIHVSSTADVAFFVARLEDVAPDGISALVTKGLLNGTRRRGLSYADPMVPGEVYELDIQLDATAWVFEPGHRIRLAVCSSDWPYIWPSPKKAVNTIYRDIRHPSNLVLPTLPEQSPKLPEPDLHPSNKPIPKAVYSKWKMIEDVYEKKTGIEFKKEILIRPPEGYSTLRWISEAAAYASAADPGDVFVKAKEKFLLEMFDIVVESTSSCTTKSTRDIFHVMVDLDVKLNGMPHFNQSWVKSVPRNLL